MMKMMMRMLAEGLIHAFCCDQGVVGHSFGATTAMLSCCQGSQSLFHHAINEGTEQEERGEGEEQADDPAAASFPVPDVACGVALDSWMRPISEDAPTRYVVRPLLIINRCAPYSSLSIFVVDNSDECPRRRGQ